MMSEEAQETSNKVYRRVREQHTRKMNHYVTTEDLIHTMFVMSDPLIPLKRGLLKHKNETLPDEVLSLIVPEKTLDQVAKEEEEDEEEEEDDFVLY